MNNITYDWYIEQVKKYIGEPNKAQKFAQPVKEHISGLRLTAIKMCGTEVSKFCNKQANELEKKLLEATKNVRL